MAYVLQMGLQCALSFSSFFVLNPPLRELSGPLAAKCSATFSSWSLTLSICCLVLSRYHVILTNKPMLQRPISINITIVHSEDLLKWMEESRSQL